MGKAMKITPKPFLISFVITGLLLVLFNENAYSQVATLNPDPDYESDYFGRGNTDFTLLNLISAVIAGIVYYVIARILLEMIEQKLPDLQGLLTIILFAGFFPAIGLAAVFPFYVIGVTLLIWGLYHFNNKQ